MIAFGHSHKGDFMYLNLFSDMDLQKQPQCMCKVWQREKENVEIVRKETNFCSLMDWISYFDIDEWEWVRSRLASHSESTDTL